MGDCLASKPGALNTIIFPVTVVEQALRALIHDLWAVWRRQRVFLQPKSGISGNVTRLATAPMFK